MARRTTAEKIAEVQAKKEQLLNEERRLQQQQRAEERKARTKRLIERGAIIENLIVVTREDVLRREINAIIAEIEGGTANG